MSDDISLSMQADKTIGTVSDTSDEILLSAQADKGLGDIKNKREVARYGIAVVIVGSIPLIIVLSFIAFWSRGNTSTDDIIKVIECLLSPVVGIVGAVTGFYFGESQTK